MYVGVGVTARWSLVLAAAGATETCGLGLAFLCLGFGLGRGLSFDPLIGENCETSSTLTLGGRVVTALAARVGCVGGVAARAGVSWLTARATRNAAPNAATMQMMAVPANRTSE